MFINFAFRSSPAPLISSLECNRDHAHIANVIKCYPNVIKMFKKGIRVKKLTLIHFLKKKGIGEEPPYPFLQ